MKNQQPRPLLENPKYSIPDRHCESPNTVATNAHGDTMHGTYKQPWVEHDPVKPENPKIG